MARRVVNTTYNVIDGFTYRLEIWDINLSQGSFTPFSAIEISDPGFVLDWKGSIDDILQPIMSSSMRFSAYLTEYERTHITEPCFGDDEFRMFVRLYRQTSSQEDFEWAGIIHPEEVTEEIADGRILTTFVASDGIASLKNIDFKDSNGDIFQTTQNEPSERALVYWLKEIVQKLPHWAIIDEQLEGDNTDGSHDYPLFTEHRLVRPVNDTYNTFPSTDAVLDHYFLKSDSFYTRPKPSEGRKKGFERKRSLRKDSFTSTYDALSDICASLGATFCFSEGKFHLFDRERIINGDDDTIGYFDWTKDANGLFSHSVLYNSNGTDEDTDPQVTYLDHIGANFLKGAARRGVYPVESIAQVHEGAGSDLIFRSGIGYDGPTFETFLYRKTEIDANTSLDPIITSNYYSNLPEQGIVDELSIPNGDNGGSFRLHFSGSATYYYPDGPADSFEPDNKGNLAVLRMDVRVYDGTYWFKLRRRVRSLGFLSDGSVFSIDVPNTSSNYFAKTYEQYSWIRDDASNYDTAYLEIMIGADPTILTDDDAGQTDEFLQDQQFSHVFHTPPLLKQDPDDANALVEDESRINFIYRFDEQVQMPTVAEGATGSFDKLQVNNFLRLYEIPHNVGWSNTLGVNGTAIDVSSSSAEAALFASSGWPLVTESSYGAGDDNYNESESILRSFQLSGIEVYLGDGTENYDARYVSHSQVVYGSEQIELTPTAFGATYENSGNRAFGRYRATHPSDTSSPLLKEDNLKFHPDGFTTTDIAYADMYQAMGFYATERALNIRGKTRQSVSGTIIRGRLDAAVEYLDICRPYKKFHTSKLSDGAETFLPHSLTIQLKDHAQRVEALLCGYSGELPTDQDETDTGRDPNNPPGGGNGGFTPGGGTTHVFQKTAAVEDTVATHSTKLNHITVTQAVNLDTVESYADTLYANFKQGTTTEVTAGTDTTTKLELTGSTANLKVNNTGLEITENSPGDVEFVVATDSTGSTAFTALHIDGTTTANNALIDVKDGSRLRIESATNDFATLRNTASADTVITLPGANGTLATTADLYTDSDADARIAAASIDDLSDVSTSGASVNQVLKWDGTNWSPADDQQGGGGGGGSDSFNTIQVNGQTDVVADSGNDTLTLAAGTNLAITTNATTDTITFTPSLTPTLTSATIGLLSTSAGIVNTGSLSSGNTTINGTLSSGTITSSGTVQCGGINFAGAGTTTIAPVSSGPAFPDDLQIESNGNVTIVLDDDDNETDQFFKIVNGAGTVIFQVNESGVTSGLLTSATPTISTVSNFESTQTGTITVSNYDSTAEYLVKLYNSGGTEQTSQTITDNQDGTWSITNGPILTGAYVEIQSLEFGKLVSAVATSNTFNITAAATQQRYWRLQITDSSKNPVSSKVALGDFRLYTSTGGGGTAYPPNMTTTTTPTPYVVSSGYYYGTYADLEAFDGSGSSASSMWWTLGLSNTANNWIQIDLGSSIDFGSGECQITTSGGWTDANYAVLYGSNTGAFSGEEREMAFFQNIDKAGEAGGTFTTYTESIT